MLEVAESELDEQCGQFRVYWSVSVPRRLASRTPRQRGDDARRK